MSSSRHRATQPVGSPASTSSRTRFRPDIQGLRAVAVLAVALEHAGVPGLGGGFVGVDVFFVISGFLITQLLLVEVARTGGLSLLGFYARRARRILPAATLVLVVTTLATAFFLSFVQAASVIRDSIWAALFVANVHFGRIGTDYFSADDPPSPLQHYWSLSVEEQFYLVWPLLLLLVLCIVWLVRRRHRAARHRRTSSLPVGWLLGVLTVVGGVSLWGSITLTHRDPTGAYFSTPARVWELAAGATAAVVLPWVSRWPGALRAVLAWSGLALIVVAVVTFGPTTEFPGSAACLPVGGAALLMLTGEQLRFGPGLLLDRGPMQAVGDWSYSFYLWHWPFLLVPAAYIGRDLSTVDNLLLLGCALAVSAASYRFVENPFRRSRRLRLRVRSGFLLYPAAVGLSLVCAVAANAVVQHEVASAASAPPITLRSAPAEPVGKPADLSVADDNTVAMVRASARAAERHQAVPGQLTPDLLDLHSNIAGVGDCNYEFDALRLCQRGAAGGRQAIVLFGDSHARAWIPAVQSVASRAGLAAYYLVKPGCTAARVTPVMANGPFTGCVQWRSWALDQIRLIHPALTIVTDDVPPVLVGADGQRVTATFARAKLATAGLRSTLEDLRPMSGRVVVVGDVPGLTRAPAQCLSSRNTTLADCAAKLPGSYLAVRRLTREAAGAAHAGFIDPTRWFCARRVCPAVVGATVVYRDQEHLTVAYAEELANPLGLALGLLHEAPTR